MPVISDVGASDPDTVQQAINALQVAGGDTWKGVTVA